MTSHRREPIETPVGVVRGRDAIFLDALLHEGDLSALECAGELSATLCDSYTGSANWIGFKLKFLHVPFFRGWEIEAYPFKLEKQSSFDLVKDSTLLRELDTQKHKHYVLSTYDYIYEIVAKNFELTLGRERS